MDKKILIVEDDKDYMWLLKQGFEGQGFLLSYATNGQEGLELAQSQKPDLMVVDIGLPQMDGIDMAQKIKENGLKPAFIFLTNFQDAERISKVLEISSEADYIVKSDVKIEAVVERAKTKLAKSL